MLTFCIRPVLDIIFLTPFNNLDAIIGGSQLFETKKLFVFQFQNLTKFTGSKHSICNFKLDL